jgi:hypothetical protein
MLRKFILIALAGSMLVACRTKTVKQAITIRADTTVVDDDTLQPVSAPETSPDNFVIIPGKQVGVVTTTSTEAQLIELLGRENVTRDSVYLGEGDMTIGTTLFKETPDQAQIIWKDTKTFSQPETVIIRPSKAKPGLAGNQPQWTLKNGLKIGSTLKEVETLNKRSFMMYGFGWDRGGYVADWKGGAFQPSGKQTFISLLFDPDTDNKAITELAGQVSGDQAFASSNSVLQKINPIVVEMTVRF